MFFKYPVFFFTLLKDTYLIYNETYSVADYVIASAAECDTVTSKAA